MTVERKGWGEGGRADFHFYKNPAPSVVNLNNYYQLKPFQLSNPSNHSQCLPSDLLSSLHAPVLLLRALCLRCRNKQSSLLSSTNMMTPAHSGPPDPPTTWTLQHGYHDFDFDFDLVSTVTCEPLFSIRTFNT
ncbi:hypothetical protein VN97_g11787 [Penicillium thymicola]|uniref:Uncharacterized protein n=1 Tax=Penicillium thymicola TaxID=293382 RepID=A0AAI9X2Q2_PENTH|nr:hypothetical protein VN97_g11787 [Penicillium thymicola]